MASVSGGEIPVAVGLMLCDQVIIDKDTLKPSLIGIFTGLAVQDFNEPQRFSIFVVLTNGRGTSGLELVCNRLDTGEPIYRQRFEVTFPDPLGIMNTSIRVRSILFPMAGWYDFEVWVSGELIAQRKIRVYQLTSP